MTLGQPLARRRGVSADRDDKVMAGGMSKGNGIPLALRGTNARPDPLDRPWEQLRVGRRHCWVTPLGQERREALLVHWQRSEAAWLGLVSFVDDDGHQVTQWVTADRIAPAG